MHPHPLTFTRDYGTHTYTSYMGQSQVKEALGLPKKLPFRAFDGRMHAVGQINGVMIFDRGQKPGRRCHRLYALIGDRFVPCGRLHQYKP